MIATFHTSTATMANPAILWTAMKMASPAEPETRPKKPVTSSTSSRVRSTLFAQKDFILYTIQRTAGGCVTSTRRPPGLHCSCRALIGDCFNRGEPPRSAGCD